MLKLATLVISAAFLNVLFLPIPSHATNEQLSCLALNIFHEARGEPKLGQYAVAHVTKNRVDSKLYPASYCARCHLRPTRPDRLVCDPVSLWIHD